MKSRFFKNTSVRNELGLTQEDYITYLKVNRSVLAMYENNKRSLPHEANLRHGVIEICLARPETAKAIEATLLEQKQATVTLLTKQHTACLIQVSRLKNQLIEMQKKYQQCLNKIRVAAIAPSILKEFFPNNSHYNKDVEYLESFGYSAKYEIEYCSIGQQQLLQLKIEALQFEATKIQEMLEV